MHSLHGVWTIIFSNVKIRRFPAQSVLALSLSCRARTQLSSYTPCLLWLLPKLGSLLRFFEQHGQNVKEKCILLIHCIRVGEEPSFYWISIKRKPCPRRIFSGANHRATAGIYCIQTVRRKCTRFRAFELYFFSNPKVRRFPAQFVSSCRLSCRERNRLSPYTPCLHWVFPKLGS